MLLAVEDCRQEINVGLLGRFIWSIFPTLPAFRQVFSTGNWSCYTPPHSTDQNTVLLHKTQELSVYRCLSWLVCFTAWVQCLMGWFQPSNCPNIHPWAAVQIPDLPGHLLPTCRGGGIKVFPSQLTEVIFPVFPGPALSLFPAENIQNISPRRCSGGVLLRCTNRLNWLLSMWSISNSTLSHCYEWLSSSPWWRKFISANCIHTSFSQS